VAEAIQSAGHMLLRNSHTPISFDEETLWLAGLDDIWEQQQDLDAALAGIPDSAPIVLLVHEPDYADTVAADGRVALQLSGHSHGGQVRLPALGSPVAPHLGNKYISGLYWVGNRMWVYTNRGLGTIPPTVRFNCRPEITLITLRSAPPRTGEPDPPTRRI
jgi:predicted MPP superfamily phosphohydrolase